MAYPQPSSDVAATSGTRWFRIKTEISSAGDIYESNQGGTFAIGPESDFSRVNLAYFDENAAPTYLQTMQFEAGAPCTLPMQPRLDRRYEPSKQKARLLLWPDQHWYNNYQPSNFAVGDTIIAPTPVLDIIQTFNGNVLAQKRVDKTYEIPFNAELTGMVWAIIPFYGRKSLTCNLYYDSDLGAVDVPYEMTALEYRQAAAGWGVGAVEINTLPGVPSPGNLWSNNLTAGANVLLHLNATQGFYDAVVLRFKPPGTAGGLMGVRITVSDDQG